MDELNSKIELRRDYVVVGAGFSGLSAARELSQSASSVIVLEARNDIGGRSQNFTSKAGCVVEIGGQFVTKEQTEMIALVEEFGLTLYTPYGGVSDPEDVDLGKEMHAVVNKLDSLCKTIDTNAPWEAVRADEWDKLSLHQWLLDNAPDHIREVMSDLLEGYFAVPVWTVSFLHFLFYARGNGGVKYLLGAEGIPINQMCVSGGTQQLAQGIAKTLADVIKLNEAVFNINYVDEGVVIESTSMIVHAKAVIVALPPHMSRTITFDPPLPPERDHLAQRVCIGSGYKISAVYQTSFWRKEHLTLGPGILDNSPHEGELGILTTFPPILNSWNLITLSEAERREIILSSFAEYLGQEALSPIEYIEKKWAEEPFIRGEVCVFPPGTWTMFGKALREPVSKVFWAGTETATEFPGQMEGAIRAGVRAAKEAMLV